MAEEIICPICSSKTSIFDVVDFNKSCEELRGKFLPLSGIPIYYSRCDKCFYIFAPAFFHWSEEDFLSKIYNDRYIDVDPDYIQVRPLSNFNLLRKIFNQDVYKIRHLDYGAGNGYLSQLLLRGGWNSFSYDPFSLNKLRLEELGKFDLITAFEVFEHVPDCHLLMKNLISLMSCESLILISTLVSDDNVHVNQRLTWWYASPRNGHISLFSQKALSELGKIYGLRLGSFNKNLHCFYKEVPSWAGHLIKVK